MHTRPHGTAVRRAARSRAIFAFVGSYQLAIALMAILSVLLAWATFSEWRYFGPSAMRFGVYDAAWFHLLLAVIGLNVAVAMVLRWPWTRRQIPFLVSHAGVVVLLLGCLLTLWFGIEARLAVFEGQQQHLAVVPGRSHLELTIVSAVSTAADDKASASSDSSGATEISPEDFQTVHRRPLTPGPFSWRDYRRLEWFPRPWLDRADRGLGWFPWALVARGQGAVHHVEGVRVEVLDYLADADVLPTPPLELRVRCAARVEGSSGEDAVGSVAIPVAGSPAVGAVPSWHRLTLTISPGADTPHGMQSAAAQQVAPDGTRFFYWTSNDPADVLAFNQCLPQGPLGAWGQIAVRVEGSVHHIPVDSLVETATRIEPQLGRLRWERAQLEVADDQADRSARMDALDREIQRLENEARMPLGDTDWSIRLDRFLPNVPALFLDVTQAGRPAGQMRLFANVPNANRQLPERGVFASYWVDGNAVAETATALIPPAMLARLQEPRVDILQGADGHLHWRSWRDGQIGGTGLLPTDGVGQDAFPDTDEPLTIGVERFRPNDCLLGVLQPVPFSKDGGRGDRMHGGPWVRLRATIDDNEETFWLKKRPETRIPLPPDTVETHRVRGDQRSVEIQWRDDTIDLGFALRVRRFERKLDPGTSKPASYSSQVDVLGEEGEVALRDITITLNHPPLLTDPKTRRAYRVYQSSWTGPEKPGGFIYERLTGGKVLPGEDRPRDRLYQSVFTANYDPGRGLKYVGCVLMTFGSMAMFFGGKRRRKRRGTLEGDSSIGDENASSGPAERSANDRRGARNATILLLAIMMFGGVAAQSVSAQGGGAVAHGLDWRAWNEMPVFHDGRIMPLNTYAGRMAENVTGVRSPSLRLDATEWARLTRHEQEVVRAVIPNEGRRFNSTELLFSWLVETDVWERVPFLPASNPTLREHLGVPLKGAGGRRLTRVSPADVVASRRFWSTVEQATDHRRHQRHGTASAIDAQSTELYEDALRLAERFNLFCRVTYNPLRDVPERFLQQLNSVGESYRAVAPLWRDLSPSLFSLPDLQLSPDSDVDFRTLGQTLGRLTESYRDATSPQDFPDVFKTDAELESLHEPAGRLAAAVAAARDQAFAREAIDGLPPELLAGLRSRLQQLAFQMQTLATQIVQVQLALYENGEELQIVPALNPGALTTFREPGDDTQPWLGLQTLLFGSDAVRRRFASPDLAVGPSPASSSDRTVIGHLRAREEASDDALGVRSAFLAVAEAYVDRGAPDRDARFRRAMTTFADTVRQLGEGMETARRQMDIPGRDEGILDQTAYPTRRGRLRAEVLDSRTDPFFWNWVVPLVAMFCFLVACWPAARRPAYWLGIAALGLTVCVAALGFTLRGYITGWVPVTNMFETMVFVAWLVVLFGLWYCLRPVLGTGVAAAWQQTAIADPAAEGSSSPRSRVVLLTLRVTLAVLTFALSWYIFCIPKDAGLAAASLALTTINGVIDVAVVASVLGIIAWWLPRFLLTACLTLITAPRAIRSEGIQPVSVLVVVVGIATSGVALFSSAAAYHGPEFERGIRSLMPVLRDNYWLALHVKTIAVGYAAGVLGSGLGAIALGFYAAGPYRPLASRSGDSLARVAEPPDVCELLAIIILVMLQLACVFIMIGTITGARWADYSWGRFWSWDPKEVWALITLLIYLALLHAHRARYIGNFGLTAGAVAAATAIVMTWYGINYVFSGGRHAYGGGNAAAGVVVMYTLNTLSLLWPAVALIVYWVRSHNVRGR